MKKLTSFLVLFFFLSCSSMKVTSDYDKTVNFSQLKTFIYYGWTEESDQIINRFDKERIESAFNDEFNKRGITETSDSSGDLVVSLFIVVEQKVSKTAYTSHYGTGGLGYYDFDYGYDAGWGVGHSTTHFNERDYEVGTLVCDVFDAQTKKLIWQGVGSGTVDENPKTNEKNIPKAVAAIMAKYPVSVK